MTLDLKQICRLCLESEKQTFNIFTQSTKSSSQTDGKLYSDMLSCCTKIKPLRDDGFPELICADCVQQLTISFKFNIQCEESDNKLRDYLGISFSSQNVKEIVNNRIKLKQGCLENSKLDNFTSKDVCVSFDSKNKLEYSQNGSHFIDFKVKDEIKSETNHIDDFWEADDDELLSTIKSKKDTTIEETNNHEDNCNDEIPQAITLKSETEKATIHKSKAKKSESKEGLSKTKEENAASWQCAECGKCLRSAGGLRAHAAVHSDARAYICDQCPAMFKGYSSLHQHRRISHGNELPFQCSFCSRRFARRNTHDNHVRIHTGDKPYSCSVCAKQFVQSSQLQVHMKRHKKDKPILCPQCGKGFAVVADLRVHERIHSGERPYQCSLCPKSFATAGNYALHKRMHNKEMRYKCSECPRSFVARGSWAVHVKRHRGLRDHACSCGKSFYTSGALQQHQVVHTGERKYECQFCQKKFSQTSHRNRHVKKDHPEAAKAKQEASKDLVTDSGGQ